MQGVPARSYGGPRQRVPCKPHASAREHLDECMAKVWENARWGAVLLVDLRIQIRVLDV